MFDHLYFVKDGFPYFHPLLVVCIALVASWLPSLISGCYRLLLPVMKALAALIRKFAIFR